MNAIDAYSLSQKLHKTPMIKPSSKSRQPNKKPLQKNMLKGNGLKKLQDG